MKILKPLGLALTLTTIMAASALAETTVKVTLIDKAGTADLGATMGMGMKADMSKAKMGININPKTAHPGAVRFDVTNLASNLVHEVVIAQITDENKLLPYDQGRNKVDTETLMNLGSVSEIEPSKSATLILDLSPGKYLLYCNVAGHYMAGMWTVIDIQ